jgi:DNA excision repair protein ERCC-5
MLTQRGGTEQICDTAQPRKEIDSAVFRSNSASSLRTGKPPNSEPLRDFGPDVETYCDERGRIRVSRVRAMGIRMTRDIQRNLDFIKENEQTKSMEQINAQRGSTRNEEPPAFPEHLFENAEVQRSCSFDGNPIETANENLETSSLVGGSGSFSENLDPGNRETIEISFMDDQNEVKDNDEGIFLELASGTASEIFTHNDHLAKQTEESDDSGCIWEEGVIEGDTPGMKVDEKDHKSSLHGNFSDDEVEWEEDNCYVPGDPSSSEHDPCKVPKGDLEEEALIQEAIWRSLNDFDNQTSETVITENLQAPVEERSLQSADDAPQTSGAQGETYSHSEVGVVKEGNEKTTTGTSFDEDDAMHDIGVPGADEQENEKRTQLVYNDDGVPGADGLENEKQTQLVNVDVHVDLQRARLLESIPLHNNKSTSHLSETVSDCSKDNVSDVIVCTTESPERLLDDAGKCINKNNMNSDKSKCHEDVASVGETSKSPQKNLLPDNLANDSAPQKENATQWDVEFSTSDINYTQSDDNGLNHSMSAIYLDKELSLLRQEQIILEMKGESSKAMQSL